MLDLTLKIRTVNVPNNLAHKPRALEIEELPKYLEVSMVGTGTLSLINVGAQQPSPDHTKYPWQGIIYLATDPGAPWVWTGPGWYGAFTWDAISHTFYPGRYAYCKITVSGFDPTTGAPYGYGDTSGYNNYAPMQGNQTRSTFQKA